MGNGAVWYRGSVEWMSVVVQVGGTSYQQEVREAKEGETGEKRTGKRRYVRGDWWRLVREGEERWRWR